MKKVLYYLLFAALIRLIREVKKENIITTPPKLTTVGQEYAAPEEATEAEKRDHFNEWCKHTGVSSGYLSDPDLRKESAVVNLLPKPEKKKIS